MITKLSRLWNKWCKKGIYFPYAHNAVTEKPSVTLLFIYTSYTFSVISIILLHIWPSMFIGTAMTMMLWIISTIFYLIREINKATLDIDDMAIQISNEDKNERK